MFRLKYSQRSKKGQRSKKHLKVDVNSAGSIGVCFVQLHHGSLDRFLDLGAVAIINNSNVVASSSFHFEILFFDILQGNCVIDAIEVCDVSTVLVSDSCVEFHEVAIDTLSQASFSRRVPET